MLKVPPAEATCDYCGEMAPVRGTPYMADMHLDAHMCKQCWKVSRLTGMAVEEIDIGLFE